jgi:hypothetical protein
MNDERPAGASVELPSSETRRLPMKAIVSERRSGVSDLERASAALAHAVQYLSSEQRAGRCTSVRGNRHAITILCERAEGLTKVEQREPAREAMNAWLAGARPTDQPSGGVDAI